MTEYEDPGDGRERAFELDRSMAVTAGAGTGKTTTLVERYKRILENTGVTPDDIVTITFTNKATADLRDKIRDVVNSKIDGGADYERWGEVGDELGDAYIHTIHGFCSCLLRDYSVESSVPAGFEVLDEVEATMLAHRVVRQYIEDNPGDENVRTLSWLWNRDALEEVLVGMIDGSKRSEAVEWSEKWSGSNIDEYIEQVFETWYPISYESAYSTINDVKFRELMERIADINWESLGVPEDDKAVIRIEEIRSIVEHPGFKKPDSVSEREVQMAVMEVCNVLTTGDGDRYSQDYRYKGSKSNWEGHEETQQELGDAFSELLDYLEPEEVDIVECQGTAFNLETVERNSAHYAISLAELFQDVYSEYKETKDRRNVLDYDDLIGEAVNLLRTNQGVREKVNEEFEYVMVDEFQDTNRLQWELVKLISSNGNEFEADNVFIVGDEKQSIYSFRGADVTTFNEARTEIKKKDEQNDVEIPLSINFRTLENPLKFVNELFGHIFNAGSSTDRVYEADPQELSSDRGNNPDIDPIIEYILVPSGDEATDYLLGDSMYADIPDSSEREAVALAARITRLLDTDTKVHDEEDDEVRNAKPEDIMVLLRRRTNLKEYERALREHGVPYTVVSGEGFYEAQEITNLVNLLHVISDPENDLRLYGVLRSPLFGFEDNELAELGNNSESIWVSLQESSREEFEEVHDLIRKWRTMCGVSGGEEKNGEAETAVAWNTLLTEVVDDTGYLASIAADRDRGEHAVANVEKFREQLREWSESGVRTLSALLTRIETRTESAKESEATVPKNAEGVRIMTIHAAKGLESPIVFVPEIGSNLRFQGNVDDKGRVYLDSVNEEVLVGMKGPGPEDAYDHVDSLERMIAKKENKNKERAEEKRVLYVACTRARDHLVLSGTHSFDDDSDTPELEEPNDASDASSWSDWVQPVLLQKPDLLEDLSDNGSSKRRIDTSEYRVSLPVEPRSIDRKVEEEVDELEIEIPDPDLPATESIFSASGLQDTLKITEKEDGIEITDIGEVEKGRNSSSRGDDSRFSPDVFGDVVHKVCEHRPEPEVERRKIAEQMAKTCDTEPIENEIDRALRHADGAIEFLEKLEGEIEPEVTYDELPVSAQLGRITLRGDIDYLAVTDTSYHIVDYKTSEIRDGSIEGLVKKYAPQLAAYAVSLHQNNPEYDVHATLFFTESGDARTFEWSPGDLDEIESGFIEVLERISG